MALDQLQENIVGKKEWDWHDEKKSTMDNIDMEQGNQRQATRSMSLTQLWGRSKVGRTGED